MPSRLSDLGERERACLLRVLRDHIAHARRCAWPAATPADLRAFRAADRCLVGYFVTRFGVRCADVVQLQALHELEPGAAGTVDPDDRAEAVLVRARLRAGLPRLGEFPSALVGGAGAPDGEEGEVHALCVEPRPDAAAR